MSARRTTATTLAALAALCLAASAARAADLSTGTVTSSTDTVAASSGTIVSTGTTPSPAPKPAPKPAEPPPPPAPKAPTNDELASRAIASLRGLVSAYNDKRRTPFMRLVSDDFTGDLGTLEDALSSDFRSYRTIVLVVTPNQTVVRGLKTQVQFRFDMTATDDFGGTAKYSGQAAYTFVDEDGKSKLYQMDRTPIFGTSLSSVENPIPKSQGAPTSGVAAAPGNQSSSGCGNVLTGTASIGSIGETPAVSFDFGTQSTVSSGSGDLSVFSGNWSTNGSAALVDLGPCDINAFTQDPTTITDSSDPIVVGDCYPIRTNSGKFAVIKALSTTNGGAGASFYYKYQTSGARCF